MKYILIILSFLLFNNCSKPKTVIICGDHVCINNDEAKQYFEENLSIEVKIINKRIKKEENLVELNLKDVSQKRQISINNKKQTNEIIKVLSNKEVKSIKKKIEWDVVPYDKENYDKYWYK